MGETTQCSSKLKYVRMLACGLPTTYATQPHAAAARANTGDIGPLIRLGTCPWRRGTWTAPFSGFHRWQDAHSFSDLSRPHHTPQLPCAISRTQACGLLELRCPVIGLAETMRSENYVCATVSRSRTACWLCNIMQYAVVRTFTAHDVPEPQPPGVTLLCCQHVAALGRTGGVGVV